MTIVFPDIHLENMPNIKGVLIDIDNTLYSYEPAHLKAIKLCYDRFSKDFNGQFSFDDFKNIYKQNRTEVTKRLAPQGTCRSRLFTFQSMFEEMKIHKSYVKALEYEMLYWNSLIDSIQACEKAREFLHKCKKMNLKTCAVSDMQSRFQVEKLKKLGLDLYIDYLVTSEEVGTEKPDSKIFNMALRKLKLESKNVIMIGDNCEKDIQGAENLGIKTFKVSVKNDK